LLPVASPWLVMESGLLPESFNMEKYAAGYPSTSAGHQ